MCNNTVAIYILKDPLSKEVRYVGKSISPEARLYRHIYEAKKYGKKRHIYCWIRSLLNKNLKPILEVIEWTCNWQEKEIYWINFYKKKYKLTNIATGGRGSTGYKHTKKWKQNASKRMIEKGIKPPIRHFTEESRKRFIEKISVPCTKEKALKIKSKTCRTPISQYDLNGNFIRNWNCPTHAAESLNIKRAGIANCIYGISKTCGGFLWKKN